MSKRYLILNADDFGLCNETNQAIETLFNAGAITSTTVMTPCPAADDALRRAAQNSKFSLGVHLTFTTEFDLNCRPEAPPEQTASLTGSDGCFYFTAAEFAENAQENEVEAELRAQYSRILSAGITPTHADNHTGSLYGLTGRSFMREVLIFCAENNLPFRFPKSIESVSGMLGGAPVPKELAQLHSQVVAGAQQLGVSLINYLATSTTPFDQVRDKAHLKDLYTRLISQLPEGISEVFFHPSLPHPAFSKQYPKWQQRVWEYELLQDDDFRMMLEREGLYLVSWGNAPWNDFQ